MPFVEKVEKDMLSGWSVGKIRPIPLQRGHQVMLTSRHRCVKLVLFQETIITTCHWQCWSIIYRHIWERRLLLAPAFRLGSMGFPHVLASFAELKLQQ